MRKFTMPTPLIRNMIDNYKANQLTAINNSGLNDAHSVWFDLKSLKSFIEKIEAETKKIKPGVSENELGIRFYYAAYPKAAEWNQSAYSEILELHRDPIKKQQEAKHTLVLLPTLRIDDNGVQKDIDFNPTDAGSYVINNSNCLQKPALMAMNHGSLIPPFDPSNCLF